MDPLTASLVIAGFNVGVDLLLSYMRQSGKTSISIEELQALATKENTDALLAAKGIVLPE